MTNEQARKLLDKTVEKLQEAGWDVVAAMEKKSPTGGELVTRICVDAPDAQHHFEKQYRLAALLMPSCPGCAISPKAMPVGGTEPPVTFTDR